MAKGIIYVMSTIIPGLIKIGKTQNFEARMGELESGGYKNCTGLKREFAIEVDDYDAKEVIVHTAFESHQVGNTELFALNKDKVIKLLMALDGKIIYPVSTTKQEMEEVVEEGISSSELPEGNYTYKVKSKTDGKSYGGTLNIENGVLTLKAGAKLAKLTVDYTDSWALSRKEFGIEPCVLPVDIVCSSVSAAASIISGHNENGWFAWKDEKGNLINIYRKK